MQEEINLVSFSGMGPKDNRRIIIRAGTVKGRSSGKKNT